MSGSPVFNEQGALIGIHGRADAQPELQNEQLNPTIYIKSGVNLGIPAHTLLELLPKSQLAFAPVADPSVADTATLAPETVALLKDLRMQSDFKRRQNDLLGAIALMDKAIQLDSQNPELYDERGYFHMLQRDYLLALIDFKQVVQLDPSIGEGYYNQSIAYLRTGSPQEAIASFRQAVKIFQAQGKTQQVQAALDYLKQLK